MKQLSERLIWAMKEKSARDGYEVTPADIARAASASDASASYWLNGSNGISAAKARKVAFFLGVNPVWLETGIGSPLLEGNAANDPAPPSGEIDEAMGILQAYRDGDELEREMLVDMAKTINNRAALRRARAGIDKAQ